MTAPLIDAHVHVGLDRYEPIELLCAHLDLTGVSGAVLVQHHAQTDNTYLVECLNRFPHRFSAIMRVPLDDDGRAVHHWAAQGCTGLRQRARSRCPGADPLGQWRAAADLGLPVSVYGTPTDFVSADFAEVIATFPDLPIVLEHLGGADPGARPPASAFAPVFALARHPHVLMKVPGFGELAPPPLTSEDHAAAEGLLDAALNAFGPDRLLWGSDWPLCCGREGYRAALDAPRAALRRRLPESRVATICGGNAQRLWFRALE